MVKRYGFLPQHVSPLFGLPRGVGTISSHRVNYIVEAYPRDAYPLAYLAHSGFEATIFAKRCGSDRLFFGRHLDHINFSE
jgi:hypothetical protein